MDKKDAIKLTNDYLTKVKSEKMSFSEAWLFGSYSTDNQTVNSDIDLALVIEDDANVFFLEVKLMTLRRGEELLIEPHLFSKKQFEENTPLVSQIHKTGIRLK
ncbi:MAG: nucleotidyltransferase domain-containing protein [Cytophagales bacterium]|nr:nucleotidyltransferase domain-containing protein [Cytophagales bacterium]